MQLVQVILEKNEKILIKHQPTADLKKTSLNTACEVLGYLKYN